MKKLIIAINGKIGSGKDTLMGMLTEILAKEGHHRVRVESFALPIRILITNLTGHTDFSQEGKQVFLSGLGMTVGEAMQRIGQGMRDKLCDMAWVEGLCSRSETASEKIILIQDLRYRNEAEALKSMGAILIRLNGDPIGINAATTRDKNHQSEVDLDNYDQFNYVYENSHENGLDGLYRFAEAVIDSIYIEDLLQDESVDAEPTRKLLTKVNGSLPRTDEEKQEMIKEAAIHYGNFLTALGFNWKADAHSADTPLRVAKAWISDLISGSVSAMPKISAFPNTDGFTGLVCQTAIPVHSLCAHHNLPFTGVAHVAYIPGKSEEDKVVGLSKLNRIVEHFSHRPNIQEALTKQIHTTISDIVEGNRGVAVVIESEHCCVKCRGVRNDSIMKTSEMSGYFFSNEIGTRQEFFNLIDQSRHK